MSRGKKCTRGKKCLRPVHSSMQVRESYILEDEYPTKMQCLTLVPIVVLLGETVDFQWWDQLGDLQVTGDMAPKEIVRTYPFLALFCLLVIRQVV